MNQNLKWYDSRWLEAYFLAKEIIARVAPAKLREFDEALAVLRTDRSFSPIRLPNLFDTEKLDQIRTIIRSIPKEKFEMHELKRFGRFVVHDWPDFTELQQTLVDRVSEMTGEPVEPSYNFLSMYTKMGICEPHLDAPSAKWTLDVCVDQSAPWPIYLSQIVPWPEERRSLGDDWRSEIKADPQLDFKPEIITPGNAVLFSGSSQWHYREGMPANSGKHCCDLLFFHFIPKGASAIVQPQNWAGLIGVPELSDIPALDE